jgi:hypothetical protein
MDFEELIVRSLDHGENVPRVPSFVQGIMPYFYQQWEKRFGDEITDDQVIITPVKDITLHVHLGFDSSWCGFEGPGHNPPWNFNIKLQKINTKVSKQDRTNGYQIHSNGGLYKTVMIKGYPNQFLVKGTIKDEEEWNDWFKGWELRPNPSNAIKNYNNAKTQALNTKHPHLLIPTCGLIMEPLISMIDMGRISYFARQKPTFFRKVLDFIMMPVLEKFKLMCESEAPILLVPDDCAYKGRPILNPIYYREFLIPHWKKLINMAHHAGKKIVMHSDGVVEPYYPDLIDAGLDAHQSVEPPAGNKLGEIKVKWGDKLAFIGNMDCSVLLPFGTQEEVIAVTKQTLREGMVGGAYMFSPCTDLTDSCNLDNVLAMMQTWKKFGNYPIST